MIPAPIFDCPVKMNFKKCGLDSISAFSKVDKKLLCFLPD